MEFILELLGWWALAIVKFLFLPWLMILGAGKGFLETFLIASSGAAMGVYLVAFFGDRLFAYLSERGRRKEAKVVTASRRRIVAIKAKYGLFGLIALSAFISVPISTLLAVKYYRNEPMLRLKLCLGFTCWAFIFCGLASLFKLLF